MAGDALANPSPPFPLLSTDPFPSVTPACGTRGCCQPQPARGGGPVLPSPHEQEMPLGCRHGAASSSASLACSLPPHTLPVKLFESLPAVFAARNNRLAMI